MAELVKVIQADPVWNALAELVECARLRGDNELPHPADDAKLWTARMAEAWAEAEALIDDPPATRPPAGVAEEAWDALIEKHGSQDGTWLQIGQWAFLETFAALGEQANAKGTKNVTT